MKTIKKDRFEAFSKIVKNPVQAILAFAVVAGFFTVLGVLLFKPIPEGVKDLLLTLFGSLTTVLVQIYQFYFGSSKGSQEKTEVLSSKHKSEDPEAGKH